MIELPIPEITLSRIWHDGWHTPEMRLTDGGRLSVIYRGVWTHSDGPDFRDAMIELDGRLVRGSVEIHLRSSHWRQHGHQEDPAYDDVILHVVLADDLSEPVHGPGGMPVPTLELWQYLAGPIDEYLTGDSTQELGQLGQRTCLPTLADGRHTEIREVLRMKGWERLVQKQLRFRQDLERSPPAEVLYRGLLDGLGLVRNRDGMAMVGELIPLSLLEPLRSRDGGPGVLAALLGVAGFLPLSPAHQEAAGLTPDESNRLDSLFDRVRADYALEAVPASVWHLNRVRPLNHPVRRLASLASLIEQAGDHGLLASFLSEALDDGVSWKQWLGRAQPPIGSSRQEQIIVNVFAPYMAAYAEAMGDDDMADEVGSLWERLPGRVSDSVARKTREQIAGRQRFPIRLAIEEQGLHQIGRFGCAELRCFECPIARLALKYEAGSL